MDFEFTWYCRKPDDVISIHCTMGKPCADCEFLANYKEIEDNE